MNIADRTALVTGANRGLGRRFAEQLVARGATVYAGARRPGTVDLPGVIPVALDITDPASVSAAAARLGDVDLVINNAGISTHSSLLTGRLADIHREMDTHYFGTLNVVRAFAPQLISAGGAVLNVLSVLSWLVFPDGGAYSAAKSAEWALTNGIRTELGPQGVQVTALHVGYMDTDMTAGLDAPKTDAATVARIALDGLAAGELEILADDVSRQVRAGLAGGVAALYPALAAVG